MATGKRYYWIKLKESFMTSDAVDFLMGQKDGANYVVLYQMLCLKTINTGGKLERHIGEIIIPYDIEKIQRDTKWFTVDTVRVALDLYKSLGLIYQDCNGTLALAHYDNLVGSETDWAEKRRRQRDGSKDIPELPTGENVPTDVPQNVPTDIDIDIDIRDKRLEKENREKISDNRSLNTMGSQPSADSPETPPLVEIILNDKSLYPLYQKDADEYAELYPAVDIMQEFRKMVGWCRDNPKNRKTRSGIRRFINAWLSRCQDKAGKGTYQKPLKPGMGTAEERQAAHGFTPTEFD